VKRAVMVWSVGATVTVCERAPPSDHPANVYAPWGDGTSSAYWNPISSLLTLGAVPLTPSTFTVRPGGDVAMVSVAFAGRIVTDFDAWIPSESVAVSTIS
jgi:hypothetical protein